MGRTNVTAQEYEWGRLAKTQQLQFLRVTGGLNWRSEGNGVAFLALSAFYDLARRVIGYLDEKDQDLYGNDGRQIAYLQGDRLIRMDGNEFGHVDPGRRTMIGPHGSE